MVVAAFTFEVSGQEMGGDGFQTQRKKSWIPGQVRAEKVLADAITIDGRKEWICKFCSETNVWTRWRCRRCHSNILAGLQEKYRQAVSAKTRVEKEREPRVQDAEIKELRAQVEQLRRQQRVKKEQGGQGDPTRRECGLEEYWNMEKQLREIEKKNIDQMFRDGQKEKCKEDLQEIERKRNELLTGHQKLQKRSQKLQILQDKKRKILKDACVCDEEMRKVRGEMNEREARFLELSEKSSNCRMGADDLEEETKGLQAGEERGGSCASQSNNYYLDSVIEQLCTLGAAHARQQIQALQEELNRRFEVPATCAHGREVKREEESGKRSKRKERPVTNWVHMRQVGAMRAFRLVLLLVLLGTRMQTVKVVESQHARKCTVQSRRLTYPTRAAASDARGRNPVKDNGKKEEIGKREKKEETARRRTQGLLKKTAREGP